jgi:gamma-glutamyltranspeptidase/glutathione hydrolase
MRRRSFLGGAAGAPLLAQTSTWRAVYLGMDGMVASGHYDTAMSGYKMLAGGGNAIDAAVAASFASTVVEPSRAGIGGDLFILIYLARTGEVKFINGTGWSPKRATLEAFAAKRELPTEGALAPLVPGAVDALLLAASRYGALARERLLAPSIELAERGFVVSENLHGVLRNNHKRLSRFPDTVRAWYRNNEPLRMGDVVVQKELGRTFRAIAEGGRDVFYKGPVARAVVQYLATHGGILELPDMAEWAAEEDSQPLRIRYKDYDLYGCPPNSHGHVMLQALNILEGFDLKAMGHNSVQYLHHVTEALKLAFADREAYLADPRFVKDIPMSGLLSKEYAARRRSLIRRDRAMDGPAPAGDPRQFSAAEPLYRAGAGSHRVLTGPAAYPDWIDGYTTYVAAIDNDRNMVSITSTIWSDFGNCMYIPSAGFFLNNRLALFYLDPKEPNVLAPRKRPRMTLNPVLVMKRGKPCMVFGTPGGDTMPQSQLQFFLNFSEFGMNVQQAVEQPYAVSSAFRGALWPHAIPNKLMVSERVGESVRAGLARLGHNVDTHAAKGVGSVKAILIDPRTGVLMGGAAPATDSYVIGW